MSNIKLYRLLLFTLISFSFTSMAQNLENSINEIKKEYAPDKRIAVFEISGEKVSDEHYILKGKSDNPQAVRALENKLNEENIPYSSYIKILPDNRLGDKNWGIVTLCCAHLREKPAHASEMVTQAIMGTPVKILEKKGGWYRIQTPDSYISWIPASSLSLKTQDEMAAWRKSERYIYTGYHGHIWEQTDKYNSAPVSDIVLGCILEISQTPKSTRDKLYVTLPDGRQGYINRSETKEFDKWASQPLDMNKIEKTARSMMGVTYLWGGTSVKGVDCSGFVKTNYFANGVILSRDASQQALAGNKNIPEKWKECQLGDLLFFGNENGRVTHVAMYLRNGEYIHSSGYVKINSVDPSAQNYLTTPFLSTTRIKTALNTPGIIQVKDHDWYFDRK